MDSSTVTLTVQDGPYELAPAHPLGENATVSDALAAMGLHQPSDGTEICIVKERASSLTHGTVADWGAKPFEAFCGTHNVFAVHSHFKSGSITRYGGRDLPNVSSVLAMPFDFDLADYLNMTPENVRELPASERDARLLELATAVPDMFAQAGLPLSRMNSSGYGMHAYVWLDSADRERVEGIRAAHKGLVALINSSQRREVADTSVSDAPTRMMRVPWSLNHKVPERPLVVVPVFASDVTVRLSDLPAQPKRRVTMVSEGFTQDVTSPALTSAGGACPIIISEEDEDRICGELYECWAEGHRDKLAMSLSGWFAKRGVSEEQALAIIERVASDDEELPGRLRTVSDSYSKLAQNTPILGRAGVGNLLGEESPAFRTLASVLDEQKGVSPGTPGIRSDPPSQARSMVEFVKQLGIDLFHSPDKTPYVTLPVRGHLRTLDMSQFADFFPGFWFTETGQVVSDHLCKEVTATLAGEARYMGPQFTVCTRLGAHEGRLFLDIGDDTSSAVEISAGRWEVVSSKQLPVRFRRPDSALTLPYPERSGSLNDFDMFINTSDQDAIKRIKGWMLGVYCLEGDKALLQLTGEQGSSKSTLASMIGRIVDPSSAGLRRMPSNEDELMLAASNALMLCFDNASEISEKMSDALCRLLSGVALTRRQLYADKREVTISAHLPILLTGINAVPTRSDLLDRTITANLEPIVAGKRKRKEMIEREFISARPYILGGVLNAVAEALETKDSIETIGLSRLVDFENWGEAACSQLGWHEGEFSAALVSGRNEMDEIALASTPLGVVFLDFCDQHIPNPGDSWQDTPSALYQLLNRICGTAHNYWRDMPGNPSQLSKKLNALSPNLRRKGIEYFNGLHSPDGNERLIRIVRASLATC